MMLETLVECDALGRDLCWRCRAKELWFGHLQRITGRQKSLDLPLFEMAYEGPELVEAACFCSCICCINVMVLKVPLYP